MLSPSHRIPETGVEVWPQIFGRMALFSLLLLASTSLLHRWLGALAPAQVLGAIRNWAALLLVVALPILGWQARMRCDVFWRCVEVRGTGLLFGATIAALGVLLALHAVLADCHVSTAAPDLTAQLIVPMASSFLLIMLPQAQPVVRFAARVAAGGCLLCVTAVILTSHLGTVHAAPKGRAHPARHGSPERRTGSPLTPRLPFFGA